MYRYLSNLVTKDKDYPERTWQLTVYNKFLDDSIYDCLEYEFFEERNQQGEYIPVAKRSPSVIYSLPGIVVRDAASFLFGEGRFPAIDCGEDKDTPNIIEDIIKDCQINDRMIEAANVGSVGSVALWLKVIEGRLFVEVLPTTFLMPTFKKTEPDVLESVVEKYKVKGQTLKDLGYDISKDDLAKMFWFKRVWDATSETWFKPWLVNDSKAVEVVDKDKSVSHSLGFVPMVWIVNLPQGSSIDGQCTFKAAIPISIEINYQLSQAGRGLKYSSSPTTVLRTDVIDDETTRIVGDTLVIPQEANAELLEISGDAAKAVIDYARELRKLGLESVGGSRADSDKISATSSGRAMELMNQSLINLADKLRSCYGEVGLIKLLRMIIKVRQSMELYNSQGEKIQQIPNNVKITLKWPRWFASTATDRQSDAAALSTLKGAGLISTKTAVSSIAADYDIEGIDEELAEIEGESPDEGESNQSEAGSLVDEVQQGRVPAQQEGLDD